MRTLATKANAAPTTGASTTKGRPRLPVWLMAALLMLATIVVYWPATGFDFVNYDDDVHVTRNVQVQRGLTLESLRWALLNPVNCNWHPLTVWSHMLDCQLFGLHPWGHHLTNLLLHALNAMLVFALLQQITGARWRSLLVAALFSFHPLRVESVAWVAERKDVLSGCFGLLALIFYAHYASRTTGSGASHQQSGNAPPDSDLRPLASGSYWLSLVCLALGLISKPTLVTWPFIMLLLDVWPLRRFEHSRARRLVTEKAPFLALAAVASVVTVVVQKQAEAMEMAQSLSLGGRSGNALISYGRYLGKLFWPTDLAVFYPHPGYWPVAKVVLAGGLLLSISGLLWAQRRRLPFLLVGWLWFAGMLVPMIGLVPTGGWAMADRHTYIPSLGVLILTVWGAHEFTRHWRHLLPALWAASGVAVVLCVVLTRQQLEHWKNSEALFRHALEVTDHNYLAHNNLGVALVGRGQTSEAIWQFQEAIRLKPDFAAAYCGLGTVLAETGQVDEAIRQFQEALRLEPDYANAHHNLGNALAKKGQVDEAISQYRAAVRLCPENGEALYNLGVALYKQGQLDEAISHYREAIRCKPNDVLARNTLGVALAKRGEVDEAIGQFQEALRLKPDEPDFHYNLANALVRKGQIDEAIRHYEETLRAKLDDADVHNNFGVALWRKGRNEEAVRQFQEAVRLKSDHTDARRNLNVALAARSQSSKQSGVSTNH